MIAIDYQRNALMRPACLRTESIDQYFLKMRRESVVDGMDKKQSKLLE